MTWYHCDVCNRFYRIGPSGVLYATNDDMKDMPNARRRYGASPCPECYNGDKKEKIIADGYPSLSYLWEETVKAKIERYHEIEEGEK